MRKPILTLALLAFISVNAASAQEMRPSLKDSLQTASEEMYKDGSPYFIVVDAVKDGYLKFGEPFEFFYEDSSIRFKDVVLPEKTQQDYNAKFRTFLISRKQELGITASLRTDGIRQRDLSDKTTPFWKTMPGKFQ